jgi:hypothetical protein
MGSSIKKHRVLLLDSFPGRSVALVRFIKARNRAVKKKLPKWRIRQIENFVKALNVTALELDRAREERRLATLAWAARNFLELSIWIDYCCASEENAKRFAEDTTRDLFGLLAAGKMAADLPPKVRDDVDALLQDLERIFNTATFKVTDEFKKVSKAAVEIGREKEFFSTNKLLSKMAHPTAFMVNAKKEKAFGRRFQAALFNGGVNLAGRAMMRLIDFMFTHFPDPSGKVRVNTSVP